METKEIMAKFESNYLKEYDLKNKTVDSDGSISYRFHFTSEFIDDWKVGYVKEHGGSPSGSDAIVRGLKKPHSLRIWRNGVCKICLAGQDIQEQSFTADELSWEYYSIIEKIVDCAIDSGHHIVGLNEEHKSTSKKNKTETTFPIAYEEDLQLQDFGKELFKRLNKILKKASDLLLADIMSVIEKISGFGTFLLRRGYRDLSSILIKVSSLAKLGRIYQISIERILEKNRSNGTETQDMSTWLGASSMAALVADYFEDLSRQLSLAVSVYADQVGYSALYFTIASTGLSIDLASLGSTSIETQRTLVLIGSVIMIVDLVLWQTSQAKELIKGLLQNMTRDLEPSIMYMGIGRLRY